MMRLLRVSLVGGSAPKPPGFFRFFSARMGAFVLWSWGAAVVLPPRPVPAAAPVARVASQQSPIPSDGGRLIINPSARALNEKAANGDSPLNFVSHAWGSPQTTALSRLLLPFLPQLPHTRFHHATILSTQPHKLLPMSSS